MRKIEKIQERALRFLLNDTKSDYNMLLSISGFETLHLKRIHMFALEVFKCLYDLNPSFMSSTFNIKHVPFKYYGAHVWNHIPVEIKAAQNITTFKKLVRAWKGPRCQCNLCNTL